MVATLCTLCFCPLSWSVHCNFTGDGKCNERGWACNPHPHQPSLILPSAGYRGLGVHDRPVYTPANSHLSPQSKIKYLEIPGVSPLSLAERDELTQFSD